MSSVQTIGVIGAGQMGSGIAHVAAYVGIQCHLDGYFRRCIGTRGCGY